MLLFSNLCAHCPPPPTHPQVGPVLGGLLFKAHPHLPLISVVLIYAAVFVAVLLFYRETVVGN